MPPTCENTSIALVLCPGWRPDCPPLALASLAAHIRGSSKHSVSCFDLSAVFYKAAGTDMKYWDDLKLSWIYWRDPASVEALLKKHSALFEECLKKILAGGAKVIGFTAYSSTSYFSLALARRIKAAAPDRVILFGGPECMPEHAGLELAQEPCVDAVVTGEGEPVLIKILDSLARAGGIPALPGILSRDLPPEDYAPGPIVEDIGSLPYPDFGDFSELQAGGYYPAAGTLGIVDSRGCPEQCLYCGQWSFWKKFRQLSGARLYAEIVSQMEKRPGTRHFYFMGLLLNGDAAELESFCDLLIGGKAGISWSGQAVITGAMTRGLISKMARAGCNFLSVGIESGSQELRSRLGKKFTDAAALGFMKNCHEAGIKFQGNFMFGLPGETREDFRKTLAFIAEARPWLSLVSPTTGFCVINKATRIYRHPPVTIDTSHAVYWEDKDGENDYPERFRRYEEFCAAAEKLGYPGHLLDATVPKWFMKGSYFLSRKDLGAAQFCFTESFRTEELKEAAAAKLELCRRLDPYAEGGPESPDKKAEPPAAEFPHFLRLDFAGVGVSAAFSSRYVRENIAKDFAFFTSGSGEKPAIDLSFSSRSPDFSVLRGRIPLWKTALYTVYDTGGRRFVDYNGRALAEYDFKEEKGRLWCPDRELMHELAYLLVLSRAGERLDRNGLHRAHALGFVRGGKGGLLFLDSGGGKTTLFLELLKLEGYSFLSDEIPLVTSEGELLPFPLRLGLLENSPGIKAFSPAYLRRFNRRVHPPKVLVDIAGWRSSISGAVEPGWVFIGKRREAPAFRKASFISGLRHLVKPLLLGLGTPQIAEYVLRPDPADIFNKVRIALSRGLACVNLLRRSRIYVFEMCGDPAANAAALDAFLSSQSGTGEI